MNKLDRSIRVIIGPMINIIDTDMISNSIPDVVGITAILPETLAYCLLYEVTGFNTPRSPR